jgi:ATP-dependent RNA helicase RhlE
MTEALDEILNEYFASPIEISLARSGTPLEKLHRLQFL